MSVYLYNRPRVLGLLSAAKEAPEDDAPRLVLADYLEEHGDTARAEFIRLQCRHGPSKEEDLAREGALLDRHGGAWLGPLWRWWLSPVGWHRGLLAAGLPGRAGIEEVGDALPWLDTLCLTVRGAETLLRFTGLL